MEISGINHINIEVTQNKLDEVVAFYQDILGLTPGPRAVSRRAGAWLYNHGNAIIHISVVETPPYTGVDTVFNHVALTCSNIDACLEILNHNNINHRIEHRSPPDMTLVICHDPAGIKIELNFLGEKPSTQIAEHIG